VNRHLADFPRVTRVDRLLAGGRRYVQGRKAQNRRTSLTGWFLPPGCRGWSAVRL